MSPSTRRPRQVAALLSVTLLCALVVVGSYRVFVRTRTGQLVEWAAIGGRGLGRGRLQPHAGEVLNVVSVSTLALALAVAMGIGLLRGRWRSALSAGVLVAGSTLTTEILKKKLLERPDFVDGTGNSLPSGHTTVAASVAAAAVLVSPRRLRPFIAVLGCAYAVATGMATVVVGWHRPSDVFAAYAVVLGWSTLTAALVVDVSPPLAAEAAPDLGHRGTAFFLASAAAPVGVVAVTLTLLTARHVPGSFGPLRQAAAYAGSMSAIATAGLVATAVWLLVVPLVDAAGREELTEHTAGQKPLASR